MSIQIQAQQKTITGTVTSASDGLPLPGLNVYIKGSNKGVQTDFDGNYSIVASKDDLLVYSYIGFKTKEIKVAEQVTINVALEEDVSSLDEVVVIGYAARTKKAYLSSSVTSISASESKRQKQQAYHQSIAQKLKGNLTGVTSKENDSFSPEPQLLYIVDGVPIPKAYNKIIENLDKKDVEFKKVYKPAQAKYNFGEIAANGCIVISTTKGNYRIEYDESYAHINENNFERVSLSPLSTFSIDVDKASYSNIRRMINNGQQIPVDAVKIEEMINYFDYSYAQPTGEHPFAIHTEASQTPWNNETKLVRIGLQGKTYSNEELPVSNLTFLIDVSGSMSDDNKLPLLKSSFKLLVNQLREKDKVAIVVFAGAAGMVLPPTSGLEKEEIISALDNLNAGGSTAGGAGIELAYKIAQENFVKNGNNRVILATDGDFNVGASSDNAMEKLIEEKRQSGVFLSVLGFGYGNYKDSK